MAERVNKASKTLRESIFMTKVSEELVIRFFKPDPSFEISDPDPIKILGSGTDILVFRFFGFSEVFLQVLTYKECVQNVSTCCI